MWRASLQMTDVRHVFLKRILDCLKHSGCNGASRLGMAGAADDDDVCRGGVAGGVRVLALGGPQPYVYFKI